MAIDKKSAFGIGLVASGVIETVCTSLATRGINKLFPAKTIFGKVWNLVCGYVIGGMVIKSCIVKYSGVDEAITKTIIYCEDTFEKYEKEEEES